MCRVVFVCVPLLLLSAMPLQGGHILPIEGTASDLPNAETLELVGDLNLLVRRPEKPQRRLPSMTGTGHDTWFGIEPPQVTNFSLYGFPAGGGRDQSSSTAQGGGSALKSEPSLGFERNSSFGPTVIEPAPLIAIGAPALNVVDDLRAPSDADSTAPASPLGLDANDDVGASAVPGPPSILLFTFGAVAIGALKRRDALIVP